MLRWIDPIMIMNGKLSLDEMIKTEMFDTEEKFGTLSTEQKDLIKANCGKQFLLMNLDGKKGDKFVTKEEYTAFLQAVDSNNEKGITNGEISRDEYIETSEYFNGFDDVTEKSAVFRGKIRGYFKSLYGYDPGE